MSIYVWGSKAYIRNLNPSVLNIFGYNSILDAQSISSSNSYGMYFNISNISVYNGNLLGAITVNVSNSNITLDTVYFNSGNALFYNTSGDFISTYFKNVSTVIQIESHIDFDNVTILKDLEVTLSVVNTNQTSLENATFELLLQDGEFNISKGLVTGYTGQIISGIYNMGNTNITGRDQTLTNKLWQVPWGAKL